jgi:signal peptidase I
MQQIGFRGWVVLIAVFIAIVIAPAFLIRQFVVHAFNASSGGMQPTIMGKQQDQDGNTIKGDRFLVEKVTGRSRSPLRGDVIVFRTDGLLNSPSDSYYVNRVAGLPGETINISPPYLLANGNRIMKPTIFRKITTKENGFAGFLLARTSKGILTDPNNSITLGTDEYFVLGDNTTGCTDSRYYGPIKKSSIVGRAILIYAPADRKKWIE